MDYLEERRTSYTEIGKIYFWTATINKWITLFESEKFKFILIDSLSFLANKHLVDVFGFVIMPNHVHLIWRMNSLNGKEKPFGSFLKYTGHQFKKMLNAEDLKEFEVIASNKQYEFWQRDSIAIELYSPEVAYQKLDYIHENPIAKDWNLVNEPSEYMYSSASFYEHGYDRFDFLKHIGEEF